jgi:hypothetical protein
MANRFPLSSKKLIERIREQTGDIKTPVAGLQDMVEIRREELQDIGTLLAKAAHKRSTFTSLVKALVIFLGAIVAARQVAEQLMGGSNTIIIVGFSLVGLLIAVLTGLEAAFRWENTSAELRNLVAICRTAARKASSDLVETLATASAEEKPVKVRDILQRLDNTIADIQTKSAKLGVDTVAITSASERASISDVNQKQSFSLTPETAQQDMSVQQAFPLTPKTTQPLLKDTKICPQCSEHNPIQEIFCNNCGYLLKA